MDVEVPAPAERRPISPAAQASATTAFRADAIELVEALGNRSELLPVPSWRIRSPTNPASNQLRNSCWPAKWTPVSPPGRTANWARARSSEE